MGFWSRIFGTGKTIEDRIGLIDAAFFTDQEKAKQAELLLKAYEPFKLAQRLLALTFTSVFLLLVVANMVLSFWFDVTDQMKFVDSYLSIPMSLIVGFYFAGGAIEGVLAQKKK